MPAKLPLLRCLRRRACSSATVVAAASTATATNPAAETPRISGQACAAGAGGPSIEGAMEGPPAPAATASGSGLQIVMLER